MSLHTISVLKETFKTRDSMKSHKRRVRFLRKQDDEGVKELVAAGYEFRGISKKGSQIFVMTTSGSAEQGAEAVDAIKTTFGLERDLQEALRSHIDQLEAGLKVIDGGKERILDVGRIDITAEDAQGRTVVIELKAGTADREVIGQILSYMGNLSNGKTVRGILIAGSFPQRAIAAARAVPNLELRKYGFSFTFETVGVPDTQVHTTH
jgi:Endonuclease NucS